MNFKLDTKKKEKSGRNTIEKFLLKIVQHGGRRGGRKILIIKTQVIMIIFSRIVTRARREQNRYKTT